MKTFVMSYYSGPPLRKKSFKSWLPTFRFWLPTFRFWKSQFQCAL